MNYVTDPKAVRPKTSITPEERARRKEAIDYARGSVRLEGFEASPEVEDLGRRYIDGEITLAQHSAAIRARHGL